MRSRVPPAMVATEAPPPVAKQASQCCTWPGNIRELRNSIEPAMLLADEGVIDGAHLTHCPALRAPPSRNEALPQGRGVAKNYNGPQISDR